MGDVPIQTGLYGQWTTDPEHPRCPICTVPVKWSVVALGPRAGKGSAQCQDGHAVSRRLPGVGPPCPWGGSRVESAEHGGVRFVEPVSRAFVPWFGKELP